MKPPRYIRQRKKMDCSPTVLLNAFKWCGHDVSYKQHFHYFENILGYDEEFGTFRGTFDRIVTKQKFPFKVVESLYSPSFTKVKRLLNKNRAMILDLQGHTTLLIDMSKTHVTLINYYKNKTITKLSIKKFKEVLKYWCMAYVLEKS